MVRPHPRDLEQTRPGKVDQACRGFVQILRTLGHLEKGIVVGRRVVIDTAGEASYSEPLEMTPALWGDTVVDLSTEPPGPPNGEVSLLDVLGVIGAFISADGAISKARADLEPGCLDLRVNITDVLATVTGLQGLDYQFEPTAEDPCESTCINPLP